VIALKTILIIEDNSEILDNLAELMETENYRALVASNGYEGLRVARQAIPDIIISDIIMSGMDGYELLEELRKHPETRTIPFIFLTASEIEYGLDLGAADYLIKPISGEDLLAAVESCLLKKNKLTQKPKRNLEQLDKRPSWTKKEEKPALFE